jgi:hypothetical protein
LRGRDYTVPSIFSQYNSLREIRGKELATSNQQPPIKNNPFTKLYSAGKIIVNYHKEI